MASRGYLGRFAVLVVVLVSAGALTGSANAQLLGGACGDRPLSRPFLPWLDPMQYTLAPRGSFESGTTGWTLKSGAAVVTGNEPWKASGPGTRSLYLPSGSSAMTPPICVETLDPTVRYFAKNRGVVALSSLLVEVVLLNSSGQPVLTLPAGVHTGLGSWHPSLPGVGLLNVTALLNGGKVNVKFRFRPVGLGAKWQIDDVYVDPLKMG
ncbi:MAG: hypothetical protein ACRDMU_05720 [Gaiellaceae bacterium]